MIVKGVAMVADIPSVRDRIYSMDILKEVELFMKDKISSTGLVGELLPPDDEGSLTIDFSNVSHKIISAEVTDGKLIVTAEIMETPMGKVVKLLIESGSPMFFNPHGTGGVYMDFDSTIATVKEYEFAKMNIGNERSWDNQPPLEVIG